MVYDLFSDVSRPDTSLFFHRNEAGDPRLGECVQVDRDNYASAQVVIIGCPQDEGVRRNGGRVGAAKAPDAIRQCLYRLIAPPGILLFDLGNTRTSDSLETTHAIQQRIIGKVIADGKIVVNLGGGNDVSYPDLAALAQQYAAPVLAFNVDAHLDVRASETRHSGTPYRTLLEKGFVKPSDFYEMGYQPFAVADSHLNYVRDKGAFAHSLHDLRMAGLDSAFRRILEQRDNTNKAIFWGIDMDVVNTSEAPGVSAPNPLGMTGEELCVIAALAGRDRRTRLFEITEVNPAYDIDNRTCRLAAVAIWHFLSEVCKQ